MKRIMLIALFFVLAACRKEQTKTANTATPVRVAAVDMYQPRSGARYSASILPGRQVSLAFRVSGFVTDIHRVGGRGLEPGDIVSGGAVLARLRQEQPKSAQLKIYTINRKGTVAHAHRCRVNPSS
jgi:multidrug efflux pump subunit AcrA (membrane-fusion protein)